MNRHARNALLAFAGALAIAVPVYALAVGEVEVIRTFANDEHPEGIAFDRDGNMYYGQRTESASGYQSALHKVTPDGSKDTVIATFAASPGSALLGLVVDDDDNVWAAFHAGDDHGVWKISSNGKNKSRISGSTDINFPNAITIDAKGNVYVTDSGPVVGEVGGAVWILEKGASSFEVWSDDEALAPADANPYGFPIPGANGIAFFPPNSIYVANTEKGTLLRIPIESDGSAGDIELITSAVPVIDGIAVDTKGDVYGVISGHAVLGFIAPVVRIDTDSGAVERVTDADYDDDFDIPLSLAFNTKAGHRDELYVTNGNLPVAPVGNGANILRARVDEKGFMLK